ncbi:MAG: hypothetical protein RR513_02850 [Muribaculaceae bacterium]
MKKVLSKFWLLTIMSIWFISCTSDRSNGWYYIADEEKDSISITPIVIVADFETLELDSSVNIQKGDVVYQICGTMNKQASMKWAKATEKQIGKRIGFIYNNEVICDPYVNCRIENGRFAISTNKGYNLPKLYNDLQKELSHQRNSPFFSR